MAYRTHCDWCNTHLGYEDDYAELRVTIHHRAGKGALDAKWAEEVDVTRHFCAGPKEDTDRGGRNRAGMVPDRDLDSCYARAIAAVTGTELADPGMGMEWRLMPIADEAPPKTEDPGKRPKAGIKAAIPAPPADPNEIVLFAGREITAELLQALMGVASGYREVLPLAGIVSLDQIVAMSDSELLAIDRVGPRMISALREAIAELRPYQRGIAVVREAFGLIVHGLDKVDRADPMHGPLARALQPLTDALAEVTDRNEAVA